LRDSDYQDFLALEPHLLVAHYSAGFSGSAGMSKAVAALRALMAEAYWAEQPAKKEIV
jgi:hypothetical protein